MGRTKKKKLQQKSLLCFSGGARESYLGFALELGRVQQRHLEQRHLQPLVGTCLWGLEILVCLLRFVVRVLPFIRLLEVLLLEEREG